MKVIELLSHQFNDHMELVEKRPGIQQLYVPLFHEDGDMVDIFLDINKNAELNEKDTIRISDYGLTLMRLSYNFDIDSTNREKIFRKILAENKIHEDDGELYYLTSVESLYPAILHFAQAISKVSSMRLLKREILHSLFEEMLAEFIQTNLQKYKPENKAHPIPEHQEYEVNWKLQPNGVPLYLFGVKDNSQARLSVISCQEFKVRNLVFKSLIVHESFDSLSKNDRARITNTSDKQFTSLDEFKNNAFEYLEREAGRF